MPRLILERRRDKQEYTDKFLIVSSADGPRGHRSRKVPLSKLFPSICPTECAGGRSVITTPHSQKFLKREYSKGSQSSKPLLRGPDHQYSQKRQKFAEPRIPRVPPGRGGAGRGSSASGERRGEQKKKENLQDHHGML